MEDCLTDVELVKYHDYVVQAQSRAAIREHISECEQCSKRLKRVFLIHPCVEELMDYHEGIVRNPHIHERVRTHIEVERGCPLCRGWLDNLKEAQEASDNPVLFDANTIIWDAQRET